MRINVTEEDIKLGTRKSIYDCAIARAVKRQLQIMDSVIISQDGMRILNKTYSIPFKAYKFISDFDNGKEVKPFSFDSRLLMYSPEFADLKTANV